MLCVSILSLTCTLSTCMTISADNDIIDTQKGREGEGERERGSWSFRDRVRWFYIIHEADQRQLLAMQLLCCDYGHVPG